MATDALTISELFEVHGANELRRRVVNNNVPLADYATFLFCRTFAWTINNVRPGHNAVDRDGVRYHIRCQRVTSGPIRTIRNLDSPPFDSLAVALMDNNLKVVRAMTIPIAVLRGRVVRVVHTATWKLPLEDDIWMVRGVRDVTNEIRITAGAR